MHSAGQLLALLFEDLFKKFNTELKGRIEEGTKKPNRTSQFDALTCLQHHSDSITTGMTRSISTGNWNIQRFRMARAGVTHMLSLLREELDLAMALAGRPTIASIDRTLVYRPTH